MLRTKSAAQAVIIGVLLIGLASATAAPSSLQQRAADERNVVTAAGMLTVPPGWTHTKRGMAFILEAPGGKSWVALVDVKAPDADAALMQALSVYRSGSKPQRMTVLPAANQNGWQDVSDYTFRIPAHASRQLTARVMRHAKRWTVRIEDLADTVASSRAADLRNIRDGLVPAGYVRQSFAGRRAHRLDPARIAALTSFVETSRKALEIPGLAIGIVQNGTTVFAGGFGVREIGKPDRVDADTLFLVASNTKPLTTLMLAKLVDEGRFGWDTPVVDLLPQFRLADPDATRQVQVKHLLCACIGLPYRNLDWEFAPPGSAATIALDILARMRPTVAFGTTYSYSNPIAAVGGLVGGHAAFPQKELGKAYDDAMASRVFGPLDMNRTTFDFDRAMRGNYAHSYGVTPMGDLSAVEPARERQMHAVRPAGGAWSNVNDLLAYVRMELAGGVLPDRSRYISEAALKARWAPQVSTGKRSWYGMGLDTSVASGVPVMFHGGRLYGFRGDTIWLPEHDVGIVILMNASTGNVLMDALPRKLLEILFDGEPEADSMVAAAVAADREQRMVSRRTLHFPVARDHAAMLATRYSNEFLGTLNVKMSGAQVVFDLGPWKAPVGSRMSSDGAVSFVAMVPSSPFPFVVGGSGERRTLTIRDAQNSYVFTEVN